MPIHTDADEIVSITSQMNKYRIPGFVEQFEKKEKQISGLISELKPLVQDIGDATLIVPLIKDYLDVGVRNDEQLIKMATIVQRALNSSSSDDSMGISDEEKQQLMEELDKLNSDFKENNGSN